MKNDFEKLSEGVSCFRKHGLTPKEIAQGGFAQIGEVRFSLPKVKNHNEDYAKWKKDCPPSRRRFLENRIQSAFREWSAYFPCGEKKVSDYLIANANGGYRKPAEAARLKAEGVKAGVSDMFLAYPSNGFAGLWIEFKTPEKTSKLSKKQREWIDLMEEVGYKTCVPRSVEEAIKIVQDYLSPADFEF